jgi:hypothetical protein
VDSCSQSAGSGLSQGQDYEYPNDEKTAYLEGNFAADLSDVSFVL